jgi:hypothetical protein
VGAILNSPKRQQHLNNLKQLALAMLLYADSHGGQLPPAVVYDRAGKPLYSWRVLLLPYLDQEALFRQFKLDEPWDSENNKKLLGSMPKVFATPGGQGGETTCYQVFVGAGTPWAGDGRAGPRLPGTFLDGTSNTILIAEGASAVEWTKPDDMRMGPGADPRTLLGHQVDPSCYYVAMADGSTRRVSVNVSDETLRNAVNPADGKPLGTDFGQ